MVTAFRNLDKRVLQVGKSQTSMYSTVLLMEITKGLLDGLLLDVLTRLMRRIRVCILATPEA